MIIGVPREVKDNEYRVAATPEGVRELVRSGHRVLAESSAGDGSALPDERFSRAGAEILPEPDDIWFAEWNGAQSVSSPLIPGGFWVGHRLRSSTAQEAAWIAAVWQALVMLVPVLIIVVGTLALIIVGLLAVVALVLLLSRRG